MIRNENLKIITYLWLGLFLSWSGYGQISQSAGTSSLADSSALYEYWFHRGNQLLLDREWDMALPAYRNALQMANGLMQQATVHQNLGSLYFLRSGYQEATIHFEYAFLLYERLTAETERKREICLNLGFTYLERDDPERAAGWFEKAAGSDSAVSRSWNQRLRLGHGNLFFARGLYREAIAMYQRGLSDSRVASPMTGEEQWIRKNLAWSYQAIGNYDSAGLILDDLLSHLRITGTRDRLLIPEILLQQGILLRTSGKSREAVSCLEQAFGQIDPVYAADSSSAILPDTLTTADVLKYRIWCERLIAEWHLRKHSSTESGTAAKTYIEILDALQLGNRLVTNPVLCALTAQADGNQRTLTAMALDILSMEAGPTEVNSQDMIRLMCNLAVYEEHVSTRHDHPTEALADTALATVLELKSQLFNLHKQRCAEKPVAKKPEPSLVTQSALILNRLYLMGNVNRKRKDPVISGIPKGNKVAEYPSPAEIRALLHKDEALIKYLLCDTNLFIFLLTTDTSVLVGKVVGKAFTEDVHRFLKALMGLDPLSLVEAGAGLYDSFIGDIEEFLPEGSSLQVIPDRHLVSIPLEALPVSDEFSPAMDSRYLIQQYEITYFTSIRAWFAFRSTPQDSGSSRYYRYDFGGCAPDFTDEGIHELPQARTEVERISWLFRMKNRKAITFTGKDVSPGVLFSLANQSRIVHLATHAYRNFQHPEFSGWMLSEDPSPAPQMANPSRNLELGALQSVSLKSDLLVLSSCSVGLHEGIHWYKMTHFPYNFFQAGINHILFSLWDVPDTQTNELMSLFYRNYLDGKKYSTALREAKLHMLSNPGTSSPTIWAVFVLLTD